ncbi:MAG: RNA polymerase sigma factor [Myxococcota bacterium]
MPSPASPEGAPVVAGPEPGISDAELVARVREGDRWAEDALIRRHGPKVMSTVLRLVGNRADAEDVTQDTFVAALQKIDNLENPAALKAWLLQIAVRRVHRLFRRERILHRFLSERPGPDYTSLATPAAGPEIRMELLLLDRQVRKLRPRDRIAWVLRRVEGLGLSDVAELCGCSLATAKRRVAAADSRISKHVDIDVEDET